MGLYEALNFWLPHPVWCVMENVKTPQVTLEYEEISSTDARCWVVTTIDGATYKSVHLSGPKADVQDYMAGTATMDEIRRRWYKPASW